MSFIHALGYASCLWTLVLARPLAVSPVKPIQLAPPADIIDGSLYPISVSSEAALSLDVTGDNIHVQCNGSAYGFNLDIVDCEQAKAWFPVNGEQEQFAPRHTGWQKRIFPLPYRSLGDKAICSVQPVLIDGAPTARATPNQVRNAAVKIRHECYSEGKLQGGIATNIGKPKTPLLKCHNSSLILRCCSSQGISQC